MSMTSRTHNGVTPELCHLSDPHGRQQGLPDFHLEHLSDKDLSRSADQSAVINDRSLKVVQQGLEMEDHLRCTAGKIQKCVSDITLSKFFLIISHCSSYYSITSVVPSCQFFFEYISIFNLNCPGGECFSGSII